ncbi:MAG: hypothetical protein GF388_10840 [Candidatus Aegiribacteria sp.]|nr:hypothetical protein [Candidatus Aegiribacteria sp.]MBD3295506.1 hypothetical protein [Candidatus Fermentibacteria bacterium]
MKRRGHLCTIVICLAFLPVLLITVPRASAGGFSPTVSLQVTTPQKLSVSLGLSSVSWMNLMGKETGAVFRVEPGLSGGKVHLGVRNMFLFSFVPIVSGEMTASLMYTWNDPWYGLPNGQTYLGAEYRGAIHLVVFTAGIYSHVAGDDDSKNWTGSFGMGIGF